MSSVDKRVVSMEFDNVAFQRGAKDSIATLENLNKALKLEGATKGLNDVATATSRFSLANVATGVENIAKKFTNMGIVGVAALASITTKAVSAGLQLAKSFSIQPILSGLDVYQTKLNSIQTILANTSGEHTTLKNVTDALQQLNTYSNQTIYNFSEMARNIGTFTAAGVKLKTSVEAIKGIANLAAISGSSSEQASAAMYQLSQALASGTVKLQDWNSVVNAGLGGKVFQDALIETARVHGVAIDKMIKDEGGFRNTLQKGWLTSSILTETLNKFTGDLNAKQLKALGYTDQQIKKIIQLGKTATEAATKVKTLPQLLDVLKESVATGWAQSFELIFGNINEAKDLFTNINNVIGGFISKSAEARNKVLSDWKALGGRTAVINGIANVFHALLAVIQPIRDAFKEIFPPITGKKLADLSKKFEEFTKHLKIGAETADKIKRTFAGVFAVFGIGFDIVKEVAIVLFDLFKTLTHGSGAILDTTASVGDFLVALKKTLESGDKLHNFFQKIEKFLEKPIEKIREFAHWLGEAWKGADKLAKPAVENLHKAMTPLEALGARLVSIWTGITNVFKAVVKFLKPIGKAIGDFVHGVIEKIKSSFGDINYNHLLDGLNVGILGAIALILKKILNSGIKLDFTGGFLDKIREAFEGLTTTLKAMQLNLKANALLKIAAAIGLLTVSVIALSLIDSKKLTAATAALTVMFTDLLASLAIFEKITKNQGFLKMPLVTTSLIALAVALDLMTIAVKSLSKLDWNELSRGLTGLAVTMGIMVVATRLLPKESLIATGLGMIALGGALKIIASAMKDFATISWSDMAKGLTGVVAVLASLTLVSKVLAKNKGGFLQDLEFLVLAQSIKILATAVGSFGKLSWGSIARGLVSLAGALTIMVTAIDLMPPTAALSAAGILVASLGLGKIADALSEMGKMSWGSIGKSLVEFLGAMTILTLALDLIDPAAPLAAAAILITAIALDKIAVILDHFATMSWGEIGKSMVVLAGSLGIIAIALDLMPTALPGAAAVVVIAGALSILAPILEKLGGLSWGTIGKGLTALAGIFAVLGIAGLLLAPVVPIIFALAGAITLIGAGVALAGAGLFLFATGLTALAAAGTVGRESLVALVTSMAGLIPLVLEKLAEGIVLFSKVIATAGPAFTGAMTTVLDSILNAIIKETPKIAVVFQLLFTILLQLALKNIPKMVDAGLRVLIGFLSGIRDNIGKVTDVATDIIVNFINGISRNLPRVIDAGIKLIISFVNGLADGIRNNTAAMQAAGRNLALAIVDGMTGGLASGSNRVVNEAENIAKQALDAAKKFLGIFSPSRAFAELGKFSSLGLAKGMSDYAHVVAATSADVGKTAVDSLKDSLSNVGHFLGSDINLTPTITPVLDLSQIKTGSDKIGSMLNVAPISLTTSNTSARNAATGFQNNLDGTNNTTNPSSGGNTVIFKQTNNSPKALSSAEIYRQTNNLISKSKEALSNANQNGSP